ncbi:hypothetical protein GCM10020331_090110 [Ectobacillus funiculus]
MVHKIQRLLSDGIFKAWPGAFLAGLYPIFFYRLPKEKEKNDVLRNQALLYKGISFQTIADIYDLLYERTVGNSVPNVHLQALTELVSIEGWNNQYTLSLYQREQEKE